MTDLEFLLLVVGFAAMLAVATVPLFPVVSRMAYIECPMCGKRFPKRDIMRDRISCFHCGWSLVPPDDADSGTSAGGGTG